MGLEITCDAEAFATRVERFLAERIERNVLATVLQSVRTRGAYSDAEPPQFAAAFDDRTGEPTAVALQAPPWPMLAAGLDDAAAAVELLAAWLDTRAAPPAVGGEPPTSRALATAYEQLTRGRAELEFEEALHVLTEVTDPPAPAPGSLRQATEADAATLVEWEREFLGEARIGHPSRARRAVERRLSAGFQYVWTRPDGMLVSMLGHNETVAGAARIGPVYTPRQHRNRGYASAAVAALSRKLLADGAGRCLLFTDLANPTSNKIYAAVGYVRHADWEQYRFVGA